MLVIDPWELLKTDGSLPDGPPAKRASAIRIARLIEYGGPLEPGHCRETLVECGRRPQKKPCPGLLWVTKQSDGSLHAGCMVCKQEELRIRNWEDTLWAEGPMDPVRVAERPDEVQ